MVEVLLIVLVYLIWKVFNKYNEPIASPIENFDLYRQDIISGIDSEVLYKNQLNGKYNKPEWYDNQIDFSNFDSYKFQQDCIQYGLAKANEWAKKGKYKWK